MTPDLMTTTPTTPKPTNGTDPVMQLLQEIMARLENVEANTEELLEKVQDLELTATGGFGSYAD